MYKGRPPDGVRRGLEIVDEDMGGRGVLGEWMSTFQDLPKYICIQNPCNTFEIKVELLPFMGIGQAKKCKW